MVCNSFIVKMRANKTLRLTLCLAGSGVGAGDSTYVKCEYKSPFFCLFLYTITKLKTIYPETKKKYYYRFDDYL